LSLFEFITSAIGDVQHICVCVWRTLACRVAARKVLMQQRVAAIEEREQQRRIRMESLGQQATTAGGPDINRLVSQLGSKGYTAAGDSQAGAAGSSSSSSGTSTSPGAAGSSSTGQGT
jgi:hypothetical protein